MASPDSILWSGRRESNPRLNLGRVARYHYATPALPPAHPHPASPSYQNHALRSVRLRPVPCTRAPVCPDPRTVSREPLAQHHPLCRWPRTRPSRRWHPRGTCIRPLAPTPSPAKAPPLVDPPASRPGCPPWRLRCRPPRRPRPRPSRPALHWAHMRRRHRSRRPGNHTSRLLSLAPRAAQTALPPPAPGGTFSRRSAPFAVRIQPATTHSPR